jgi:hypothetical protein
MTTEPTPTPVTTTTAPVTTTTGAQVTTTATPAAPATAPAAEPDQQQDIDSLPAWARESLSKANREAAQFRTQLRELEPVAAKARELEEAQKTEQQRQADALTAAQEAASKAQSEAVRYRVAAEHGISKDDFDLLGSGTEEEITARAVRIAERNAQIAALQGKPTAPGSERPVEQLRPGATPGEPKTEDDVLYAQLFPQG